MDDDKQNGKRAVLWRVQVLHTDNTQYLYAVWQPWAVAGATGVKLLGRKWKSGRKKDKNIVAALYIMYRHEIWWLYRKGSKKEKRKTLYNFIIGGLAVVVDIFGVEQISGDSRQNLQSIDTYVST